MDAVRQASNDRNKMNAAGHHALLGAAIVAGSVNVVKVLLQAGADIRMKCPCFRGAVMGFDQSDDIILIEPVELAVRVDPCSEILNLLLSALWQASNDRNKMNAAKVVSGHHGYILMGELGEVHNQRHKQNAGCFKAHLFLLCVFSSNAPTGTARSDNTAGRWAPPAPDVVRSPSRGVRNRKHSCRHSNGRNTNPVQ